VTPVLISNVDLIVCPTLDSDQAYCFGLDMAEQVQGSNQPIEEKKRVNDSFMFVQVRKSIYYLDCCSIHTSRQHKENQNT